MRNCSIATDHLVDMVTRAVVGESIDTFGNYVSTLLRPYDPVSTSSPVETLISPQLIDRPASPAIRMMMPRRGLSLKSNSSSYSLPCFMLGLASALFAFETLLFRLRELFLVQPRACIISTPDV